MLHMHVLFADDLQLWIPMIDLLEVCDILESDLESITQWCHRWRMSINEVICYNYRRKQMVKVTMNGQELAQTHSKKCFGVIKDEQLLFNDHVQHICNSALAALNKISHICNHY